MQELYAPIELDRHDQLISKAEESDLIFLYAAKDAEHNNAVALKEYLEARMKMPDSLPLDHHSS
ncbi:DUF488 family protein [Methanothrix sp.]|uniref:DUF488 family protein n=1 Tax=Methanothrix sp. TaxID=90426 RepID=UPI003BB7EE74